MLRPSLAAARKRETAGLFWPFELSSDAPLNGVAGQSHCQFRANRKNVTAVICKTALKRASRVAKIKSQNRHEHNVIK